MAFNQEKIQELYPEAKMYSAMKINNRFWSNKKGWILVSI